MNKKLQQSLDTQRRIADAAKALFIKKGYKATSIEDIVEATGSSKGNIYYHFKSKEGLFLHLIEEWDREWEQGWKEKEDVYPTATEKLYGMMDHLVLDDLNHPISKAIDEFINGEDLAEDVKTKMADIMASHFAFNKELLQQGIAAGEFAHSDAETLAIVLESILVGLSQMTRLVKFKDVQRLYHEALTVFLHGIAAK